jgi:formylglycine-generating enzyme required for sulfatase activity
LQLRYLAGEGAAPAVLGRGTSDSQGKARVSVPLTAAQQTGGSFEVLITAGSSSKTCKLPAFPQTLEWEVWLPRPLDIAAEARPSERAQKVITNSIGMKLVLIPAGEFLMGSPQGEGESDEHPQHQVRITKPFYMGVYEVTQGEYERITGTNPSKFKDVAGEDTSRFPVENVSWNHAITFCRKLSKMREEKSAGREYRLPNEAEWEYACRAGTTTPFSFGSALNGSGANCDGNFPFGGAEKGPSLQRTTRVSSYEPNAFGLYDMHGNVWEWCADWHDRTYYAQSPVDDPTGSTRVWNRATRGGSWSYSAIRCRSAYRNGYSPLYQRPNSGFRVVCDVTAQPRKR